MATEVLTAFSPAADFLAVATADGRVKTWDVGTGHIRGDFVDIAASTSGAGPVFDDGNGHLAVDYLCIAWGSLTTKAKKGKKKSLKDVLSLLLVLGTGAGDVLAWDTTLGELKWRTNDCNSGGVKAVAFSKNGQVLYTAGGDGMITELNCESGEVLGKFRAAKIAISCIAISPDGDSLLAGSSELKLLDLSSKKRIRKFTGHAGSVNAVVFSGDGKYVFSSASEERHVAVWQVDGTKSEKGAAFSLALDHPAAALDCSSFKEGERSIKVVALSRTGAAYIWRASSVEELAAVMPMKVGVSTAKSTKNLRVKVGLLAVRLAMGMGEGSETILVAHGNTAKPVFEQVVIGDPGSSVMLEASTSGALLPSTHDSDNTLASKPTEVTVLGPESAADAILTKTNVESEEFAVSVKKKKKRRASVDLDADAQIPEFQEVEVGDGKTVGMDDEDDDDTQTMEERLIALGIVEKSPNNDEPETTVVPPRADSVQVLLSQALQADDTALLEQCLAVSDEKVIANTVRALRPSEAAKFLSGCIVKLETRPNRGLTLVPWVRTVLLQHAATLMSNPSMQPVLTTLYQLIEARLSVFRPLLALSGRLDLIMAQISLQEANETNDTNPLVVYEEQDSEVEVEEVVSDASSEDSSDKDSDSEDAMKDSGDEEEFNAQGNGNGHQTPSESAGGSDP